MSWHSKSVVRLGFLSAIVVCGQAAFADATLTGITFASEPGTLYVSVRSLGKQTGQEVGYDEDHNQVLLAGKALAKVRMLPTGESIVKVADLTSVGATLDWDNVMQIATIHLDGKAFPIKRGEKRVVVDQGTQSLTAYQGDAIVMQTNVSTGREGHHTPNGHFTAGPVKERMHYSHLYDDAPMPYSVQVAGNVFIHGYGSVPRRPASHGCVRMPLARFNAARYFYEWVDVGTPVTIQGQWAEQARARRRSHRRHFAAKTRHVGKPVVAAKAAPAALAPSAAAEAPQAAAIKPQSKK